MSGVAAPSGGTRRALLVGGLLGAAAVAFMLCLRDAAFVEVEDTFPEAMPAQIAAWTAQWHARADPWLDVPDPPGTGPVLRRRFWLSHWSYDLEVRRRGARVVIAVAGVAPHAYGGGWAAFGEGRISGDEGSFRGAVATFSWSCLGVRYRHASDGIGRIVFDADGRGLTTLYMAHEAPELWAKAYGRVKSGEEEAPAFGALKGEIPYTPAMPRLAADATYRVRVAVRDSRGIGLPGALVQLKGKTRTRVVSDAEGRCEVVFRGRDAPWAQVIAAGAHGYRNVEFASLTGDAHPGLRPGAEALGEVVLVLPGLPQGDSADYVWANASPNADADDVMACGTCHPWHHDQWLQSRHARMADNGHVTWERDRMRQSEPHAPDDCHGCHQPAHAASHPADPWLPRGTQAGNHCDFCHKISHVTEIAASGVLGGYALARPDMAVQDRPGSIQHVFGTAPDVTYAYMGAAYNPLFKEGHLCAGCHQGGGRGSQGGLPKIDTHGEWSRWLASRSDPQDRRSCQDCHMPAGQTMSDKGQALDQMAWDGLHRTPGSLHDHRFPGAEARLAAEALDVRIDKRRDLDTGRWVVEVEVANTGAGHKVPTGTWSKRVVVGVWASAGEVPLRQVGGPRTWLDEHATTDMAYAAGDWRNPAGFVLGVRAASDPDGKQRPPPFWQVWPAEQIIDTRLAPDETRRARLVFEPTRGAVVPEVEVRILYRRARLPRGLASVPWPLGLNDPAPEVLWKRVRR